MTRQRYREGVTRWGYDHPDTISAFLQVIFCIKYFYLTFYIRQYNSTNNVYFSITVYVKENKKAIASQLFYT